MLILGIDPGLTGAVAVLKRGEHFTRYENVFDMPITPNGKDTHVKNIINSVALAKLIQDITKNDIYVIAFLEEVHTMPMQGIATNGSLMHSLGVIEGILSANSIKIIKVTPQKWKKHHGIIGTTKNDAVEFAKKEYPNAPIKLMKHSGRADALLIAGYGAVYARYLEA